MNGQLEDFHENGPTDAIIQILPLFSEISSQSAPTLLIMTITAQWVGMVDVGSARYEPALLPTYPTIRVLSYSNHQRSSHSISK